MRMLPFIYVETGMAPAGVRAIGTAMLDRRFSKTCVVPQQWNRHFRPPQMGKSLLSDLENREYRL